MRPATERGRTASRRGAWIAASFYAESSTVLAWLLGEDAGSRVREAPAASDIVVASDFTLIECDRLPIRAAALGDVTKAEAADRRAHLNAAAARRLGMRVQPA